MVSLPRRRGTGVQRLYVGAEPKESSCCAARPEEFVNLITPLEPDADGKVDRERDKKVKVGEGSLAGASECVIEETQTHHSVRGRGSRDSKPSVYAKA